MLANPFWRLVQTVIVIPLFVVSILIATGADDPTLSRAFYVVTAVCFAWMLVLSIYGTRARYLRRSAKSTAPPPAR